MSYDPREHGAECHRCPLAERRVGLPVPPEWNPRALALVVAEVPGDQEVKEGRPLVGPAGRELQQSLASIGQRRASCSYTNAVLCHPPGEASGALDRLLYSLKRTNEWAAKNGLPPTPSPIECCLPRLRREVARLPNVIALGKVAYFALTGSKGSITDARGGPITIAALPDWADTECSITVRILPSLHPAHVMRYKRWRGPLRADLGRAFRWFTTGLQWKAPRPITTPRPAELRRFLESIRGVFSVYDVETSPGFPEQDHYDPLFDRLRCLGIGTADGRVIVVPFRSVETGLCEWYDRVEQYEIVTLLHEYFASPAWPKGGWNSAVYDSLVVKSHFEVLPANSLDGIPLHRVAEPEMKHSLGVAGGLYTDVDRWKAGKTATEAVTDEALWQYNATDVVVTALCIPAIGKVVQQRGQVEQARTFGRLADVARGLHETGIRVDEARRRAWDRRLLAQAQAQRRHVRELAGWPTLNPASPKQLGELLFDRLQILPHGYSEKTGEPSTGDDALRKFLSTEWNLPPRQRELITAIRAFRRVTKRRGVVVRLRPITDPYFEEETLADFDETPEEREERFARARKGKTPRACGLTLPDGRVHADWLAHGTIGWRFSSSGPNMQNLENVIRDMFIASPGNVLVGCDEAQLELRMVAGLAGCAYYLERFNAGADPHFELCVDVFGRAFLDADKDGKKRLRRCVKELTYGCAAKGTRVVTLGPEGARPIEELRPGVDRTWCWDGEKYAPTLIVNKWSRGSRDCIRVTFGWGGQGATGSAVFTLDHPFIMRDGTMRRAGTLVPGDRLMPFYRWNVGPYRMLDPRNDRGRHNEHRQVCGLSLDDPRVVHHRDGDGRNNDPANLDVLASHSTHSSLHWDDERKREWIEHERKRWAANHDDLNARLSAGRIASPVWQAATRENYRKMRAGLEAARARGGGTTKGQRRSILENLIDRIGVLPDAEIARLAGVTREAVYYFRRTRGIPKPNHVVLSVEPAGVHEVWDIEVDHPAHNFAIEAGVFVHNSLYRAGNETKLEIITSAEDDHEELIFPDFTLREVAAFTDAWLRRNPEIPRWWESLIEEYRARHFLTEPVMGLRLDFLDGEEPEKLANYKPQAGGAALVHRACFRMLDEIPFHKWGPGTGLIQQAHDSLVVECPEGEAERVKVILERSMSEHGRPFGLDLPFLGEARIGRTLKEV